MLHAKHAHGHARRVWKHKVCAGECLLAQLLLLLLLVCACWR